MAQLSKCYNEKVSAYNDLCKLSSVTKSAHDKDAAELAKSKKEIKDLKAYILKITTEADAKFEEMKEELITKVKRDATITVLEARMRMANEVSETGFDTSMWPVHSWETKLAKLKGNDSEVVNTPASKTPKTVQNPPADPQDQGTSKMDQLASVSEVLEGMEKVAAGNTLGEEGK